LNVLTTQWWAMGIMFLVGFVAMALVMWVSIFIAFRSRPLYQKLNSQLDRYQQVVEPLRRLAMIGIPVLLGLFVGVSTAARWSTVLQYLNRTEFGQNDPQFGFDVSFYVFELPFLRGLVAYASAIVLISGLGAIATHYLYGGIRINGREVRVTRAARIQIAVMAGVYVALQAVSIWLDQYATLTQSTGTITGAAYTEVNAGIPGRAILAGIAGLVALLFVVTAVIGRWRLPLIGTALLIVSSLVVGTVYPAIVERFTVAPNAKQVEAQYIARAIEATRHAYGLDDLEVISYDAVTTATEGQLREDAQTTASIRILDPAIVSPTFRQLERVKQYYQFATHLDVDRYEINGQTQDTVIAVRELNQAGRSEEHTSELQSRENLVCRLLLETKKLCSFSKVEPAPLPVHFITLSRVPSLHDPSVSFRSLHSFPTRRSSDLREPDLPPTRARQAVLPVRDAPRRRPLRDQRADPRHRDRGARAQPGR